MRIEQEREFCEQKQHKNALKRGQSRKDRHRLVPYWWLQSSQNDREYGRSDSSMCHLPRRILEENRANNNMWPHFLSAVYHSMVFQPRQLPQRRADHALGLMGANTLSDLQTIVLARKVYPLNNFHFIFFFIRIEKKMFYFNTSFIVFSPYSDFFLLLENEISFPLQPFQGQIFSFSTCSREL